MKITAIVKPFEPSPKFPTDAGSRQIHEVDKFVAALARETGKTVPIIEGDFVDAPADGFIIAFATGLDRAYLLSQPRLGPRTILINVDRSEETRCLDQYQLCAAVEQHQYFLWRTHRHSEDCCEDCSDGLFGRKDIAQRMGATFCEWGSEHYGRVYSECYRDLPALLGAYLSAYAEQFSDRLCAEPNHGLSSA